jgi:hypothetical protein
MRTSNTDPGLVVCSQRARIPTAVKQICTRNPSGIFAPTPASRQTAPPCPTGRPALAAASLRLLLWPKQRSCSPPFSARPAEALTDHSTMAGRCFALRGCGLPCQRPRSAPHRPSSTPTQPNPAHPVRGPSLAGKPPAIWLAAAQNGRRGPKSNSHPGQPHQPATPVASPAAVGVVTFTPSPRESHSPPMFATFALSHAIRCTASRVEFGSGRPMGPPVRFPHCRQGMTITPRELYF